MNTPLLILTLLTIIRLDINGNTTSKRNCIVSNKQLSDIGYTSIKPYDCAYNTDVERIR